ncbi:MAG: nuclear transport factor 2 family protein [Thermomicrobiales bacterium]|nr:nuclear transport factor 2 family protein [Thermomicrobiales bacterium]
MSTQKTIAHRYFDGFRRSDHAAILECLSDDVAWHIHGHTTLQGKEAFDAEIENDAFEAQPVLDVDRVIEEGNVVVNTGIGEGAFKAGGVFRFHFVTILSFTGDLISRVDSYIVPIGS